MKNEPGTQTEICPISIELPNHTSYIHWMSTGRNFDGPEIAKEAWVAATQLVWPDRTKVEEDESHGPRFWGWLTCFG